jgi:predicted nucleotide-binding protein
MNTGDDKALDSLVYYADVASSSVAIKGRARPDLRSVMNVFQQSVHLAKLIRTEERETGEAVEPEEPKFNIFIGHGRSREWEKLKNHLQDKHDLSVVTFESGARAGHQARDILEEMLDRSSLALRVFTGEDDMADGQTTARQNVVHEAGLFQGRLGFSRGIILKEEGVENLSNLDGIQYIEFSNGRIEEAFGDVIAVIGREMRRKS